MRFVKDQNTEQPKIMNRVQIQAKVLVEATVAKLRETTGGSIGGSPNAPDKEWYEELRVLDQVAEQLTAGGFEATVEYPGYVSVQTNSVGIISFGFENGPFEWNDDSGEQSGSSKSLSSESSVAQLVSYAQHVIAKLQAAVPPAEEAQVPTGMAQQALAEILNMPGSEPNAMGAYDLDAAAQDRPPGIGPIAPVPPGLEICGSCGGDGFVKNPDQSGSSMSCPRCGEFGYVPAEQNVAGDAEISAGRTVVPKAPPVAAVSTKGAKPPF
jgi:hypothetical protein